MISFSIDGKNIDVFRADAADAPVIYLHTFTNEGARICKALKKAKSPSHTLVAISNLDWDKDMTPWYCPPISSHDTPCPGGADEYLETLTLKILPKVEEYINGAPKWRGIAGYSLAGLFAVYAMYRTNFFSRIASMSGSLWYPDIEEYIYSHDMKLAPSCIYFSLGDKESKTKNEYLKTVQDNTKRLQQYYSGSGIDSVFVLNSGGHYIGATNRTAAGIDWILRR